MNILKKILNTLRDFISPRPQPLLSDEEAAAPPQPQEKEEDIPQPEAKEEAISQPAAATTNPKPEPPAKEETTPESNHDQKTDVKLIIEEMKFGQVKAENKCRACDETPMTIKRFIQRVLNINANVVLGINIALHKANGDFEGVYVAISEMDTYDVMSLFTMQNADGTKQFNDVINAVVSINVRVIDGTAKIISVLEPTSFVRMDALHSSVRVSTLFPVGPGRYRSDVTFFNYISKPNWDLLREISRMRNCAYLEEVWNYRISGLKSLLIGQLHPTLALQRAKELKDSGMDAQSYFYYNKAQSLLNNQLLLNGGNKKDRELLADSAYSTGECLLSDNRYVKAQYFFQKAHDVSEQSKDIAYLIDECIHLEAEEAMKYHGLGLVLHTCLGMSYDEVEELVFINYNGRSVKETIKENIINFNCIKTIISIPVDATCIMLLSLKNGTTVVIVARHMANGTAQASIMIPAPLDKDGETKDYYDHVNLREHPTFLPLTFSLKEVIWEHQFKEIRDAASRKAIERQALSPQEENSLGIHEEEHFLFISALEYERLGSDGSALVNYLSAYYGLISKGASETLDKYDKKTLANACYKIGCMLNEKKFYNLATAFLQRIKDKELLYKAEYINTLINNFDVRALNAIDRAIEDEKTDQDFISYMRRSRAQFLIMTGDPQSARRQLNPLLVDNNIVNRRFAYNALQHIIDFYPSKK